MRIGEKKAGGDVKTMTDIKKQGLVKLDPDETLSSELTSYGPQEVIIEEIIMEAKVCIRQLLIVMLAYIESHVHNFLGVVDICAKLSSKNTC